MNQLSQVKREEDEDNQATNNNTLAGGAGGGGTSTPATATATATIMTANSVPTDPRLSTAAVIPGDPRFAMLKIATAPVTATLQGNVTTLQHQHLPQQPQQQHQQQQQHYQYQYQPPAGESQPLELPPGVTLPPSVSPTLVEGRVRSMLLQLPPNLMNEALNEYDEAVKNKAGQIRNYQAYLVGVIKRYLNVQDKSSRGEGGAHYTPMGELTAQVEGKLQQMINMGICVPDDLNEKVRGKMKILSEKDALEAIQEISSVDRSQIRSFPSYFMGIMNRYARGEAKDRQPFQGTTRFGQSRQGMNERDTRGSGSGRGSYGRFSSRSVRREDRSRSPDRDPRSPRSRFRDDDRRHDRYDRDYDRRDRDRSRDRYDDDRYDDYRDRRSKRKYRDYDDDDDDSSPRRKEYSYRRDRSDRDDSFRDRDPRRKYRDDRRSSPSDSSDKQSSRWGPSQKTGFSSTLIQQQPNSGYGTSVPPPPPPRTLQHPLTQQAAVPTGAFAAFQQQPQTQQYMQPSQTQQYMQTQPGNSAVPFQQVQPPQQLLPQGVNTTNPQPVAASGYSQAPASFIQPHQLMFGTQPNSAQPNVVPQQATQQPQPQVMYQATSGAANPFLTSYSTNVSDNSSSGFQTQNLADLLGIADKAASVVQALASQGALQQQQTGQGVIPQKPQLAPQMPTAQQPQQQQQLPQSYDFSHADHPGILSSPPSVPKEPVSVNDLPMMVQYAIRNLQATGYLESNLDDGICRMIKNIPESSALQALERFSSCDQSTMRNKTAYLAGILRRELDKAGKNPRR